jgi:molybdopterin synthase catalytic subunit
MPMTDNGFEEPNNEDRAHWALEAVNTYAGLTRNNADEQRVNEVDAEQAEEVISDLLADMRHLCKRLGVDFEAANARGDLNYTAELEEAS